MKRERAFTTIIEYHASARNCRFSSTQFRLRSEYTYHPRSSSYDHHCTTRGTNIRSSLEKIRLTVSFRIRRETLDHTMTRKKYSFTWTFAAEGLQTSRASHQQSPKEKTSKHFINALLLHEALKHGLHLSILSTHDRSDIACW